MPSFVFAGYHGTATVFDAFNPEAEGIDGIFFSSSADVAMEYAVWRSEEGDEGRLIEARITLQNPWVERGMPRFVAEDFQTLTDRVKAEGFDGVLIENVDDSWNGILPPATTCIAFHPGQIEIISNLSLAERLRQQESALQRAERARDYLDSIGLRPLSP